VITIPASTIDGVLVPSTPIPRDAISVVCDGENYVIYQPGDTPPDIPQA
jgi:hypothetical protein